MGAPVRVLLLEDDPVQADLIRKFLTKDTGWEVSVAATGKRATELAREGRFDAAVLDYKLRETDGIQVLRRLRKHDPSLPVILLTAQGSEEVALDAYSHGAVEYLVKDMETYQQLAGTVQRVVDDWHDITGLVLPVDDEEPARGSQAPAGPNPAPPRTSGSGPTPPRDDEDGGRDHDRHRQGPIGRLDAAALERALGRFIDETDTLGVVVGDRAGRPVAWHMPGSSDPDLLAVRAASMTYQAGSTGSAANIEPAGSVVFVHGREGLLALAAGPGRLVLVLLLSAKTGPVAALRRLQEATRLIAAATSPGEP